MSHSQPVACALPETHTVVRQIVSVLGFEVLSSDFASRLAPALDAAVEYFDGQIASIPGPYDISAAHYGHHPMVSTLFPARQEIARGFGRSRDVMQPLAFLAGAEQKQAFALIGVRRPPGHKAGEFPSFCEHTLRSLAASESGARQALRNAALTRLVTEFGEHIDRLRQKGSLPRAEWNMENRGDQPVADTDQGKQVLADEELQPENLVRGLIAWLSRASDCLHVREGIYSHDADGAPGHEADLLAQLLSRDRRCWTVCLVCFPTDEALAAVQNEVHPHRYILI
ncbi:MAG: hypothetical protein Q7J42_10795 [Sulfuritalea sp.]|nr:hypothetical protein [Sulfuritalea sp.]